MIEDSVKLYIHSFNLSSRLGVKMFIYINNIRYAIHFYRNIGLV